MPPQPPSFDLVLASASPRRRELLERAGLVVQVAPTDLDETPASGETAVDLARRLASAKCDAATARMAAEANAPDAALAVLAADTLVTIGGVILGKPRDAHDARDMLRRLAGRRHEVVTAYRIRRGAAPAIDRAVTTAVTFRLIDDAEVEAYVASGEWRGKAGGYALQGIAAAFVTELRGSHTNVIGLPLAEVLGDLRAAGAILRYPPRGFGVAS